MRSRFDTISRIAGVQHGQITRQQLLDAGVDSDRIRRWCADGRLRRRHVGVYAVGHEAPSPLGDLMAAVLAGGAGAVVSHASAAHLLGLVRGRPPAVPELTVPTTAWRRRPGIVIHRVRALPALDVALHDRIPVTTVPRTLLDLAPRLAATDLIWRVVCQRGQLELARRRSCCWGCVVGWAGGGPACLCATRVKLIFAGSDRRTMDSSWGAAV